MKGIIAAMALTGMVTLAPGGTATLIVNAAPAITATHHVGSCEWVGKGKIERDKYLYFRIVKDTCKPHASRGRAAGVCAIDNPRRGNWVDKVHQLTSIICPHGELFRSYGYDYQNNWPHGKVHYVKLGT